MKHEDAFGLDELDLPDEALEAARRDRAKTCESRARGASAGSRGSLASAWNGLAVG